MNKNKGMSEIVQTITSLVEGAILLFGVKIILYGHLSPGGGFAGGLILSFLFVLLFLSYGSEVAFNKISFQTHHLLSVVGAFLFLIIGILGFFFGGVFFLNFINNTGSDFNLISGGTIIISNIAIGLKVGASVFLIFAAISMFRGLGKKNE